MKNLIIFLFLVVSSFLYSQDTINDYYNEITTGSEYGVSNNKVKFLKDIKIYVFGEKNDTLICELNKIIIELNTLIETVNIEITLDSTKSNLDLYFGSSEYFCSVKNEKFVQDLSKKCYGFFILYPRNGEITYSCAFINTHLTKTIEHKKHLLREELTQSLGFGNDSYKYPYSIFYQGWNDVTSYSELDKLIIKKHYNLEK